MRASKLKSGLIVPALLAVMLAGCANTQTKPNPEDEAKNTLESGVAQANTAQAEGKSLNTLAQEALAQRVAA